MDTTTDGSGSRKGSPRDGDERASTFFDFESTDQEPTRTVESSAKSQTPEAPPRNGIRVSLACVPCRSRHVKCGAEMPHCNRCQQDDKACFYAKSRRGMRDKNVPRKRASMREGGKGSPGPSTSYRSQPYPSRELYVAPVPDVSENPRSSSLRLSAKIAGPKNLINLYYTYFHKPHPFILPQYYLLARLESDPESLKYLAVMMQWIGSLYAEDISSVELRGMALSQLDLVVLPPNGFTVQTLLIAAVAVSCEDEKDFGRALLDRAIYLALEIRMNHRTFANMERDPVLAESWRRTWWGLYIMDAVFAGIRRGPNFFLFTIESDVELPCEEWEYDGIIPRARTLEEYDARDLEEEMPTFSSFTYFIDLCRIVGVILGIDQGPSKNMEVAVANTDAMLVTWKLHLPREKQGIADKNEEVDELLFQAHNLVEILIIFIHRPLSRLHQSPVEYSANSLPAHVPTPPTNNDERMYWLHTRKALEAAETCVNLFALPCSILHHTPLVLCGLSMATLTNLSACAYVVNGEEWLRTRDRVRLGLGAMKTLGTVWALGRNAESGAKSIARSVFSMQRADEQAAAGSMIDLGDMAERSDGSIMPYQWEQLGDIDYSLLDDLGQPNWEGMGTYEKGFGVRTEGTHFENP